MKQEKEPFGKIMDEDERDRLRRLLNSLERDENGLSPILVELSDVLPAEVFLEETLR